MKALAEVRLTRSVFCCLVALGCSSPETEEPTVAASSSASTDSSTGSSASSGAQSTTTGGTSSSTAASSDTGTSNTGTSSSAAPSSNSTTSGSTDSNSPPSPSFYEVQVILESSCVLISCHSPYYNLPNMSNWEGEEMLHERLMAYEVQHCSNEKLIAPGEPENSAILKVVTNRCGDFVMPPLCEDPCMDPDSYATLEAWIRAGARAE